MFEELKFAYLSAVHLLHKRSEENAIGPNKGHHQDQIIIVIPGTPTLKSEPKPCLTCQMTSMSNNHLSSSNLKSFGHTDAVVPQAFNPTQLGVRYEERTAKVTHVLPDRTHANSTL